MTTKDKDDDIVEIKHHKKIKGEPLYVDEDVFGPEPTYEITEYEHICLEAEAENLQRLQIDLIVNNIRTLEDVHALQDTKINILAEKLIKYQAEENRELNEENTVLEESIEKISYRWKTAFDNLSKHFKSSTPEEFKNWQKLEEEENKKKTKTLIDLLRERKSD
jgi:hypothetical protein